MGLEHGLTAAAEAMGAWHAGLFPGTQMNVALARSSQVPGLAPGQAELSLRLEYSGGGAGHRAISGFTVSTEVCEPDIRHLTGITGSQGRQG